MVGNDFLNDIVLAKLAGMRTVWLRGPGPAPEGGSAADRTVDSLHEVPSAVRSLGAG